MSAVTPQGRQEQIPSQHWLTLPSLKYYYTAKESQEVSDDFLITSVIYPERMEANLKWNLAQDYADRNFVHNYSKEIVCFLCVCVFLLLLFCFILLCFVSVQLWNKREARHRYPRQSSNHLSLQDPDSCSRLSLIQPSFRDCQAPAQTQSFEHPDPGAAQVSTLSLGSPSASFLLLGQNPHLI